MSIEITSLSSLLSISSTVAAGVVTSLLILKYLGTSKKVTIEIDDDKKIDIKEYQAIITMKNELENLKKEVLSHDKEEFITILKSKILETTSEELLLNIEKKVEDNTVYRQKNKTINRLTEELFSLQKRGNINLTIGIITTLTGLILLGFFTLSIQITSTTLPDFFVEFLPRFSLVVLIEIFAYFFLRLYKLNLSEIKYIQNEITSVEFKYLGLYISINEKDISKEIVTDLMKIERNFILEKGQTTVDIEKMKAEELSTQNMLGKVTDLLNGDKKKKP